MAQLPPGLTLRPPEPRDAQAVAGISNAGTMAALGLADSTPEELFATWSKPHSDAGPRDAVMVAADDVIVAYVHLRVEAVPLTRRRPVWQASGRTRHEAVADARPVTMIRLPSRPGSRRRRRCETNAQTSLDGPCRTASSPGSGPSRKFTSADDLRRLAALLYRAAATGDGALARAGLGRHDARLLLGLMLRATYPGVVRPGVHGAVAHKAGWLTAIQNDLAIAFGARGGPCFVGVTSSGASLQTVTRWSRLALPVLLAAVR